MLRHDLIVEPVHDGVRSALTGHLKEIVLQSVFRVGVGSIARGEQRLAGFEYGLSHGIVDPDRPYDFIIVVELDGLRLRAPLLAVFVHELGEVLVVFDTVALGVLVAPAFALLVCRSPCDRSVATLGCEAEHVLHHILVVGIGGTGEGNIGS